MNGNGQGQWIIVVKCDDQEWVADVYRGEDYDERATTIIATGYSDFKVALDRVMGKENQDAHTVKKVSNK